MEETKTTKELEYQDLLYFGYDFLDEAVENRKAQCDFMKELKERFPEVKFKDAYDSIKGFRQGLFTKRRKR